MHSKFGLFQMSSLSLCAALSKVNFVVYYNLNMSAVFNMMRQTKARKSKSVCRVQLAEADKRQEILKLSAGFSLMRQTEIAKQAVCLLGTAKPGRQK